MPEAEEESVDTERIASIRLKLAQIYEYERGKGARNLSFTSVNSLQAKSQRSSLKAVL